MPPSHDNSPIAGHAGKHKTTELVARDYWWPGMSVFVRDYVDGCATCQLTKANNHPVHVPMAPNEVPNRPFSIITTDFITDLPICEGYDSIHVVVDRSTKAVVVTPCTKKIDSDGTVDILIQNTWRRYGLWDKMISDRGPQFAAKVIKALYKRLGVNSQLTTTYHPQANGQTERMNQKIEQYLCMFFRQRQDDWARLLSVAEFIINSYVNSSTGRSPFEMMYEYQPDFTIPVRGRSNILAVNNHIDHL